MHHGFKSYAQTGPFPILNSTSKIAKTGFMKHILDRAQALVTEKRPRLILPERGDARVDDAAQQLAALGFELVPTRQGDDLAEPFLHQKPGLSAEKLASYVAEPTHRAAAMLAMGEADLVVSGAATETATVLRAAFRALGLAAGTALSCSSFLMYFPDGRTYLWGDCGANIAPNAAQMAHIGTLMARAAQGLFGRAELALLSYSTGQSGAGPTVDLMREATQTLQSQGIKAHGPVQGDAALNPAIGARKGMADLDPNVLLFPHLDAGNIAYKLAQELAGATALGPFMHGFGGPMADLSRGASAQDIVGTTLITALMELA